MADKLKARSELVSVIIPSYNRAGSIINCLDSIVNQTYQTLEIIIVDDGSKDNTADVVENYKNERGLKNLFFYQQENQGAPVARNKGLSKANGVYIVFFDSDDIMLPERIEKQILSIVSEKSDCCAGGFINSKSGDKYIPYIDEDLGYVGSLISWSLMGSTQSWMYKKDILVQIGGYDPAFACYQDWDITFRFITNSRKISIVQEVLSVFVDDDNNERITSQVNALKRIPHIQRYYLKVIKWLSEQGGNSKSIKHMLFLYANEITLNYYRAGMKQVSYRSYKDFSEAIAQSPFFTKIKFRSIYITNIVKLLRH